MAVTRHIFHFVSLHSYLVVTNTVLRLPWKVEQKIDRPVSLGGPRLSYSFHEENVAVCVLPILRLLLVDLIFDRASSKSRCGCSRHIVLCLKRRSWTMKI